jgi:hypothetical protein
MEGLRKTTETLNQDSQILGQDLNSEPPNMKQECYTFYHVTYLQCAMTFVTGRGKEGGRTLGSAKVP